MTSSVAKDRTTVTTTHTAFVAAPPRAVYRLIADAGRWPYLFAPILHVERLAAGATDDRLRLWTIGNGAVRSWTSRRVLDADGLRIRFEHETPAAPVEALAGEWVFVPLPGNATSVVLLHEFRAIDDDPVNTALIKQMVDRNSTSELAALRHAAELGDRITALVHSFADSVVIEAPLRAVYRFLSRAEDWDQMAHISRIVLDEAVPNVQTVELDSPGQDGAHVTTRMIRVCFPYHSIFYKQTQPPDAMLAHVGRWQLFPTADGVRVTAHNTIMIRPGQAPDALQPGRAEMTADVVRHLLRENCMAILLHGKNAARGWPAGDEPLDPQPPEHGPTEPQLPEARQPG